MQFTISPNDLASALKIAGASIESRSTLPILECVLIDAEASSLKLIGGNLRTMIEAIVPARITTHGAVCVPFSTLTRLISTLDDEITCALEGTRLQITSGKSKAALATLPEDNYPPIKSREVVGMLAFSGADFRRMVTATTFCAAANDNRPILNGIWVNPTEDGTLIYAADGFRLARYEAACTREGAVKPITIPIDAMDTLAKLPKDDDIISIAFHGQNDHVTITGPTFSAVVQALEGRYPDASKIIPQAHYPATLSVAAETLMPALKRVRLFSSDNANSMKVELKDGVATLYGKSAERGDTVEVLEGAVVTGEEVGSFNANYMTECAASFAAATGNVFMSISSEFPLLMQAEGNPATYVIMPMNSR